MNINGFEVNGQTKVADYYKQAFPHDDWGNEMMNKTVTFQDVYECLYVGGNVYPLLGADDSVVRERIFDTLATLMGCSYEHVYYQWLNSENPLGMRLVTDMTGLRFPSARSVE